MRKITLISLLIPFIGVEAIAASSVNAAVESAAREKVEQVYRQMDVARRNFANAAYQQAQHTFCSSFQHSEEQELPNDLRLFYLSSQGKFLTSFNYITSLSQASNEGHPYQLSYTVVSSRAIIEEEGKKGEAEANYVKVIVKKDFVLPSQSIALTDTLVYDTRNRKIVNVYNRIYHKPVDTDASNNPTYTHYDAAEFYSQGNYQLAYTAYLEVAEKLHHGEAYYRLALMTYRERGCKSRFSSDKVRMRKAWEYLMLAKQYGDASLAKRADYVEYWWR